MISVEVIIPWRDGCEHRRRAFAWVLDRWHTTHPDWPTVIAECADGPWVKAHAVMPAIERSTADLIIVADADAWSDIHPAVDNVAGGASWAIPHGRVHRLTAEASQAVYAGADPKGLALDEPPYHGVASGGLVVLHRSVALDVPLDPRFEGWGGEDHGWGWALGVLHGRPFRGSAPLWHLWHPPAPRVNRKVGSHTSEMLRRRYRDARTSVDDMRRLVAEVPRTWDSTASFCAAKDSSNC